MTRLRLGETLGALSCAACLVACFPKSDGEQLASTSEEHERRLAALEEGIAEERNRMTEALANAQGKMHELEEVLERATQVVTRNSADLGTEVAELRTQLQTIEGQIAELRNELESTQRTVSEQARTASKRPTKSGDPAIDPSEVPSERPAHYSAADQAFQAGDHGRARGLFRLYVQRYRTDERADDALYSIGKSYLEQGNPRSALLAFRRVISQFPQGDALDETLFDMGDAFYRLHSCDDARSAYQALIQQHRRSPLASQARRKLRALSRAPRGYCQ